ncbi:hypothetical protein C8R46DRAFT_1215378 [Mycena filopes]|nr:hypothetical protein C8R46DRAFT_1215378 [Mycena filopes]
MSSILLLLATGVAYAFADPCKLATASTWVSSKTAHACELNVPFNRTRSLAIVDTAIKSLAYYSLETWFQHSPNSKIPHDVDIRSLLQAVENNVSSSNFSTDWDFNIAVTDAFNREQDGHTVYVAACTEAFSWNLPFSISTLAATPSDPTAFPVFLVNYDFPNQDRHGLEAHYRNLGVHVRPYDGARILAIDGVDAGAYLTDLAAHSSIYYGLLGGYESLDPRYMSLMSRYSADTVSSLYTQQIGSFGQRMFYPGAHSVTVRLQTAKGVKELEVPWAATFTGKGNTTESFSTQTCSLFDHGVAPSPNKARGPLSFRRKAVVAPDTQPAIRTAASTTQKLNYVQPNLTSFGNMYTLDIYQLEAHPKVGVVYFEQFEPAIPHYTEDAYFRDLSKVIFTGLTGLKKAGVKHVLLDISGNRGGYIAAGAIAMWSLWPQDLYPGFPAVYRADTDLIRRQAAVAADQNDANSEYYYGNYRDEEYIPLTSNAPFMDPPVAQTINGVPDAYSHPFLDNFGNSSKALTNFSTPPFAGEDYVLVSNGICASTCSIFSSYLFQKHRVRSAVFGGAPNSTTAQFDGGVKGSEVTYLETVVHELDMAGLGNDTTAPRLLPIAGSLTMNFRNAIPYIDKEDGILEYVWEQGIRKYQFTHEQYNNPQKIWEFVAEEFFGDD